MTANSAELVPGNNSNVIANDCSMQAFVETSARQPRKPTWSLASGSLPFGLSHGETSARQPRKPTWLLASGSRTARSGGTRPQRNPTTASRDVCFRHTAFLTRLRRIFPTWLDNWARPPPRGGPAGPNYFRTRVKNGRVRAQTWVAMSGSCRWPMSRMNAC